MQLIEISEPNNTNHAKGELAVGIDFGTTNSLIAISKEQIPEVIKAPDGKEIIPSKVYYKTQNISSIKRLFGKNNSDIKCSKALSSVVKDNLLSIENNDKNIPQLHIDGKNLSSVEIASTIFMQLKTNAEKFLNKEVNKAVVTLPAYYDDAARHEVLLAAKLAGFDVIRLLAEPTAAAYAYKLDKKVTGTYIVYDLGGGTFDISILHMSDGILQVVATAGDNMLGGDDIDLLICEYWQNIYHINDKYKHELLDVAKQAKESLSSIECFVINKSFCTQLITLERYVLEDLIKPMINRTIFLLQQTLLEINGYQIEGIILVGGSTRIPLIKKLLQKTFPYKVLSDIDPDKVVALGAALQAENLISGNGTLLIDAVPLSIGIELYGGLVEKIIMRNSPVPYIAKKEYTTFVDNQNAIEIHVVQGEREFAKDCRSLATFTLNGLPKKKAGSIKIEVLFSIDTNGVLAISASENTTKKLHTILLKPSYGLTKEEVDNMLANAYKNIRKDHEDKNLQETVLQAQRLINNVNNLVERLRTKLSKQQILNIYDLMKTLRSNIDRGNIDSIIEVMSNINTTIEPLTDMAVSLIEQEIKGTKLKELEK